VATIPYNLDMTNDYSSPYRENGISPYARPRKKKERQPWGDWSAPESKKTGHRWGSNKSKLMGRSKYITASMRGAMRCCEICGQPEFAVGSQKCKGRKSQ